MEEPAQMQPAAEPQRPVQQDNTPRLDGYRLGYRAAPQRPQYNNRNDYGQRDQNYGGYQQRSHYQQPGNQYGGYQPRSNYQQQGYQQNNYRPAGSYQQGGYQPRSYQPQQSAEQNYNYYNNFIWNKRYADCISFEKTLRRKNKCVKKRSFILLRQ